MRTTSSLRAHIIAATLLLCGTVLYNFAPAEHSFYPRCVFRALSGLQCPGCGGTRALYCLLHFHFAEALHYNALVTLLAPLALGWFVFWYVQVCTSGRGHSFRLPRPAVAFLYMLVLLFGIIRNLPHFS
jgi:hypothetical protein